MGALPPGRPQRGMRVGLQYGPALQPCFLSGLCLTFCKYPLAIEKTGCIQLFCLLYSVFSSV